VNREVCRGKFGIIDSQTSPLQGYFQGRVTAGLQLTHFALPAGDGTLVIGSRFCSCRNRVSANHAISFFCQPLVVFTEYALRKEVGDHLWNEEQSCRLMADSSGNGTISGQNSRDHHGAEVHSMS
jgi:hypothetical protein